MAKTIVSLVIRSSKPVEVSPGVFDYTNTIIKNVRADIKQRRQTFNFGEGINIQSSLSTVISCIFKNDRTNRAMRITHVLYNGILYEVTTPEVFPPRVNLTLGQATKYKLTDLEVTDE